MKGLRKIRKSSGEQSQGEGSVWTSFSDLFTSLAIIFLVMFVVAIIKLSLSSLDKKAFMEANLSHESKAKTQEKRSKIKDSMQEIINYRASIQNKMIELNNLTTSLEKHQILMENLLQDQSKQEQIVNNANKIIQQDKQEIITLSEKNYQLDKYLEQKNNLIFELTESLAQLEAKKSEYKRYGQNQEIENSEIKKEVSTYQVKVVDLNKQLERLELEKLTQKEFLALEVQDNRNLKRNIENIKLEIKQINLSSANVKQRMETTLREKAELKFLIQKMDRDAKKNLKIVNSKIANLRRELLSESSKSYALEQNFKNGERRLFTLEQENRHLGKGLFALRNEKQLAANKNMVVAAARAPASSGESCLTLKCLLARNISQRLTAVDPSFVADSSGKLILQMDDTFGFKVDSYVLRSKVKEKLKKIVRIYSEELFRDNEIRQHIENIYIVGHASPRYQSKYVPPESRDFNAFNHNFNLSSMRAMAIVNFIFSREMGHFAYDTFFRQKLFASGRGYASPLPLAVGDAPDGCGELNCRKSRRVEIYFTLKGDGRKIASKLQKKDFHMNKGD